MVPQEGIIRLTQTTAKLIRHSTVMAMLISSVNKTTMMWRTFGIISSRITVELLKPNVLAIWTWSLSEIPRVSLLITLANLVQSITTIARTTLLMPTPRIVIKAIEKSTGGNDIHMSTILMIICSTAPLRYPARIPIVIPRRPAKEAPTTAT